MDESDTPSVGSPTHVAQESGSDGEKLSDHEDGSPSSVAMPENAELCPAKTVTVTPSELEEFEVVPAATRKSKRKGHPHKSPEKDDPNFCGIAFTYHLTSDGLRTYFQLKNLDRATRGLFWKYYASQSQEELYQNQSCGRWEDQGQALTHSSFTTEEKSDIDPEAVASRDHLPCSSCQREDTPLWRDKRTGSGTVLSLCNACGIRLKKKRLRCRECGYVPRSVKKHTVINVCAHCCARASMEQVDI